MNNKKLTKEQIDKLYAGMEFGRLTAIGFSHRENNKIYILCKCFCGVIKAIYVQDLKNGTVSCGNHKSENTTRRNTTHNMSKTDEFRIWCCIRVRCSNPNRLHANSYIERGITMCDRWWDSFDNFYRDMGNRPSKKHSIDRIDNNGNYEPSNCRWATIQEQSKNRRTNIYIEYNGEIKVLTDWATHFKIPRKTLHNRYRKGLPFDQLFFIGNLKDFYKCNT